MIRSGAAVTFSLLASTGFAAEYFGLDSVVEEQAAAQFSRFVNMRPGDGSTVNLNPPRFSWFYNPDATALLTSGGSPGGVHDFQFQVSVSPTFSTRIVDVSTAYNFYNFIAPLTPGGTYYWRVGYDVGTGGEWWSSTRSFTVAGDAVAWDRSGLADPSLVLNDHPRMLFTSATLPAIQALATTDSESSDILDRMRTEAATIMASDWWLSFPTTDTTSASVPFSQIAHDLVHVAFLRVITGESQYAGVVSRAVTLASYPRGGGASPEGAGGDSGSNSTQTTESIALLFDWLYDELSVSERQTMIDALEWRVEYIVNEFGGWTQDGVNVHKRSLAARSKSHVYEACMDTAPAAIALWGHSTQGEEWYRLITNYLLGVTNGFGFDESWNEGAGYGPSKLKWLMYSTIYFDTALGAGLSKNPFYTNIGDFFCRLTPVGLPHSSWGNLSTFADFKASYKRIFRQLAFLTGDGRVIKHWEGDGGTIPHLPSDRLWIEYVLPYHYTRPTPALQTELSKLFAVGGWAMGGSLPASSPDAVEQGVGFIFQARPRAGYSHSFNSDGSIQMYAYGEQLNHGGSNTLNLNAIAYHPMGHSSILIDGLGQAVPDLGQYHGAYARFIAFQSTPTTVYAAADLTNSYPSSPGDYTRWGLPLDEVYTQEACDHLQRYTRHLLFVRGLYFVIYDEIATSRPATLTWLYHIFSQQQPLDFSLSTFTIDYAETDVNIKLRHISQPGLLQLDDRQGEMGRVNPITGEDYRPDFVAGDPTPYHNLWVSTTAQQQSFRFMTVVVPYRSPMVEPVIERIDDKTARITFGGQTDLVTFDPATHPTADVVVDVSAVLFGTPEILIFSDGFETGSTSRWTSP